MNCCEGFVQVLTVIIQYVSSGIAHFHDRHPPRERTRGHTVVFRCVYFCLTIIVTAAARITVIPDVAVADSRSFDLQAHRGGRGEQTEESLAGFERSMRMGVSTLELDINITRDHIPIVWHDPYIQADKCRDTHPVTPADPQYPYVGKLVHTLSYQQIQTLICDKKLAGFPDQKPVEGNKIITLDQLLSYSDVIGARNQKFNIESKVEAAHPEQSASPEEFVRIMVDSVRRHKKENLVTFESFDWRTLPLFHAAVPQAPIAALWSPDYWKPGSPWIAHIDYNQVHGDPYRGALLVGATIASMEFGSADTQNAQKAPHYLVTKDIVAHAHRLGLKVIPWTVDTVKDMNYLINAGVDGIISDYPTLARSVLSHHGIALPRPLVAR